MKSIAQQQLEADEGRVRWVYKDSEGIWTIGIGCNVDGDHGGGLDDVEIDFLFQHRYELKRTQLLQRFPWMTQLDEVRLAALINMAYQLGVDGLSKFPRMLTALRAGSWLTAYQECLDSAWHKQTPSRCERIATQVLKGVW